MVAVDESGATVKVPPLEPRIENEISRFANGKERRAIRAELAERYKSLEVAKTKAHARSVPIGRVAEIPVDKINKAPNLAGQ